MKVLQLCWLFFVGINGHLKQLNRVSKNGSQVINLTSKTYNKFIKTKDDREYALVVLATAKNENYNCRPCKEVEKNFRLVAQSYGESKKVLESRHPPLFFGILDIDNAREVFMENRINTVPFLNYYPADDSNLEGKLIPPSSNEHIDSVSSIKRYCYHQHGVSIPKLVNWESSIVNLILISSGLAIVSILIKSNADFVIHLPWNKTLWKMVSLVVYFVSIGGMVFCIIQKPQFYIPRNQQGEAMFIHPQGRQQFVLEGLLIAILNIGCALCIITLYKVFSGPSGYFRLIQRSVQIYILLGVFIYLLVQIFSLYSRKNSWYSVYNVLPSYIQRLVTGSIKYSKTKSLFISWFRRFVKIGKYWVEDFQSIDQFISKAISLLKLKPILAKFYGS